MPARCTQPSLRSPSRRAATSLSATRHRRVAAGEVDARCKRCDRRPAKRVSRREARPAGLPAVPMIAAVPRSAARGDVMKGPPAAALVSRPDFHHEGRPQADVVRRDRYSQVGGRPLILRDSPPVLRVPPPRKTCKSALFSVAISRRVSENLGGSNKLSVIADYPKRGFLAGSGGR